jgi:hypothetical protein
MARSALVLSKTERIPDSDRPAGVRTKVSPTAQRRGWAKKLPGWGFPILGKAAVRLLSAHATSAGAERVNSAYGSTYTAERVSTSRETADAMERVRSTESQRRAKDDPNKFPELVTLKAVPPMHTFKGFFERLKAHELSEAAGAAAEAEAAAEAAENSAPRGRGRPKVVPS